MSRRDGRKIRVFQGRCGPAEGDEGHDEDAYRKAPNEESDAHRAIRAQFRSDLPEAGYSFLPNVAMHEQGTKEQTVAPSNRVTT